jgi:hypothetical protein
MLEENHVVFYYRNFFGEVEIKNDEVKSILFSSLKQSFDEIIKEMPFVQKDNIKKIISEILSLYSGKIAKSFIEKFENYMAKIFKNQIIISSEAFNILNRIYKGKNLIISIFSIRFEPFNQRKTNNKKLTL